MARFPWDPKPDPPVTAATAPPATLAQPAHSQSQFSPQLPLPTGATGVTPHNANGTVLEPGQIKQEPGVSIKQEPGAPPNFNPADTTNKNNLAANRAAQQLQAQYGIRAAGSINAIQGQHAQQQQQQQQYTQPGQPPVGNGQTDGPGDDDDDDFEGILLKRSAAGDLEELGRVEIDRILHQQMAAKAKSMEGGGLMLSLQEASKQQAASAAVLKRKKRATGPGVAAYDGGDDEDEIDEDAINSDLDDPEDEHDDDEVDDEGLGHIMLCMYDKVQRVKNKWLVEGRYLMLLASHADTIH